MTQQAKTKLRCNYCSNPIEEGDNVTEISQGQIKDGAIASVSAGVAHAICFATKTQSPKVALATIKNLVITRSAAKQVETPEKKKKRKSTTAKKKPVLTRSGQRKLAKKKPTKR